LMEQYLTGEIKRNWLYDRMVNANLIDKADEQ
jgi:hypothetical protein